jgi:hypothetical protein
MRRLILPALILASASQAGVYKCITPDGDIVFQQTICPGSAAQEEADIRVHSGGIDGSTKDLEYLKNTNLDGVGVELYNSGEGSEKLYRCREAKTKVREMQQRTHESADETPDQKNWSAWTEYWKSQEAQRCR